MVQFFYKLTPICFFRFLEKLVELVHLLVSNHLRRLEGRLLPQFSVPQFLSLFVSFTFEQTDWGRYASCLDTWQVFLNYVKQSSNPNGNHFIFNGDSLALRYQDSLVTLSEHVLLKTLFASNITQLEELDDEAIDGNVLLFHKSCKLLLDFLFSFF